MVLIGAHFPDFDLDFGTRFHRSPLTHSFIIPSLLFIAYFHGTRDTTVLRLLSMFFMGYASHLFLDIFPAKASILARFLAPFKHYTPGDIRLIPEKWEKPWLIISGLITLAFAFALLSLSLPPNWVWDLIRRLLDFFTKSM